MQRIKQTMSEHSLAVLPDKYSQRQELDNLVEKFWKVTTNDKSLAEENIMEHSAILDPWFREGSLGYIFGLRGSGKTWFAWQMAINISKGEHFGPWKCEKPYKVLYADGEMPMKSMQDRLLLLNSEPSGNLYLLSHEKLAEQENIILQPLQRGSAICNLRMLYKKFHKSNIFR